MALLQPLCKWENVGMMSIFLFTFVWMYIFVFNQGLQLHLFTRIAVRSPKGLSWPGITLTMRLFTGLLLLVLFIVAEARRGKRLGQDKLRGRSKSNSVKRFAGSCKEYIENGDKFLDCQDCHLTAVLLDWPEDIDHLLLAQNRLKVLQDNTFSHFRNLVSLDLQLNEISLIMEGAFSGLSKLTTLLLQHNRLQVVSEAMFIPMPRLRYLRLHDNPWTCNCQLDSLVHFLQVPSNRYMGNFAKCAEPTRFWGQQLKTLDPKLLCMPPMQSQVHLPRLHSDTALLCHIRDFPKPLLDCRSRGESTTKTSNIFYRVNVFKCRHTVLGVARILQLQVLFVYMENPIFRFS